MALIDELSRLARPASDDSPVVKGLPELPGGFITGIVDRMDRTPENVRVSTSGYVHVSALNGFCGRRMLLMRQDGRQSVRSVTGGHRVMWRIGRAVESHIREQYLKAHNNRNVLGRWTCLCGRAEHVGFFNGLTSCNHCNSPLNVYGEYTLYDHDNKIVGNPDLLVTYESTFVISEIKSMNKAQWDTLIEPLPDHIFQAGMYYDLLRNHPNNYRVHSHGVFVYCTKDYKYGSPYKEFHVDFTKPTFQAIRDRARAQLSDALRAEASGSLPPRTVCHSPNCAFAKACSVATACFNLP